MRRGVNDIIGKFVNTKVYDVRDNQKTYLDERQQFRDYMRYNPEKLPKKPEVSPKQRKFLQKRQRYISIDSRSRDTSLYPDPNDYTIDLGDGVFTNVVGVRMISSKFTNTGSNDDIIITSSALGSDFAVVSPQCIPNSFGILQMPGNLGGSVFNSYVGCRKTMYDNSILDALDKIDFQFRDLSGNLVDFAGYDHSFVLLITEIIKKVKETEYNTKIGVSLYTDDIFDTYH